MSDHPLKRLIQKITGQDAEAAAMRVSLEEVIATVLSHLETLPPR